MNQHTKEERLLMMGSIGRMSGRSSAIWTTTLVDNYDPDDDDEQMQSPTQPGLFPGPTRFHELSSPSTVVSTNTDVTISSLHAKSSSSSTNNNKKTSGRNNNSRHHSNNSSFDENTTPIIWPRKFHNTKAIPDFGHDFRVFGIPVIVILIAVLVVVLVTHYVPDPQPASIPSHDFSEARANGFVDVICKDTRGLSDDHNNATFNFLLDTLTHWRDYDNINNKMGMEVKVVNDVTSLVAKHQTMGGSYFPQYVISCRSIAVRICPRRSTTESSTCGSFGSNFLFVTNYDTVAGSKGAGANGLGVAITLEVIHNLIQSHQNIKNSLVFLFANGANMYSAPIRSFVKKDPWARNLVFTTAVWGGGLGGKQTMTRPLSSPSLRVYSHVPRPYTSSAISHPMSAALASGYEAIGSEIADTSGFTLSYFHNALLSGTSTDGPEHVPGGSLQHGGDNVLAIAKYLLSDKTNWKEVTSDEEVHEIYFDVLGLFVVAMTTPVFISTSAVILFLSATYVSVRWRANVHSKLNLGVGRLDMRLILVCLSLLFLTVLVACMGVGVIGGLLTMMTILIYSQPNLVIGTFVVWGVFFVVVFQVVVQSKLPVAFRTGPQRWCHHMDVACLVMYMLIAVVTTALNRSDTYIVPMWLLSCLIRCITTHILRIIPAPTQSNQQQNDSINAASSSATRKISKPITSKSSSFVSSRHIPFVTPFHYSASTNPPNNTTATNNTNNTNISNSNSNITGKVNTNYHQLENLSSQTDLIDNNTNNNTNNTNNNTNNNNNNTINNSTSTNSISRLTINSKSKCKPSSCLHIFTSFGNFLYRKLCVGVTIWAILRWFTLFVRLLFCIFLPSALHLQMWVMVVEVEYAWQHDVLVWAIMAVGLVFPLLLILIPDIHQIRHPKVLCIFLAMGAVLTLMLLWIGETFSHTHPNIVQMHHIQQEWHTDASRARLTNPDALRISDEDTTPVSYAFVQATDISLLNNDYFPYHLCKFETINQVKRCKISTTNSQYLLNVPSPKPLIQMTKLSENKASSESTVGVQITPGSFVFGLDLTQQSILEARWYGMCDPKNCTISSAQLTTPLALDVERRTLFITTDSEERKFYAEIKFVTVAQAPLALFTFYTQQSVSPIAQNLLPNMPSRMTFRGTFFGPSHLESFWYLPFSR